MWEMVKKEWQAGKESFSLRPLKDLLFVGLGIIMGVLLDWSAMEILIFSVLVLAVLRKFPSRLMILPSLGCLGLTMLLLALNRSARAEEFSIYAFYFLVIAIILALLEVRRESEEKRP